jgi:hypothetical protein
MIAKRSPTWLRLAIAMIATHPLLLDPSVVTAQGSRPSLLGSGVGGAMYGRCQPDLLRTGDLLRATTVLGAFAPDAVTRLIRADDELTVVAKMCAHQIHQHRCTAKMVAVAGDVLTKGRPGGKKAPDLANPGAVVGGTAGAVLGLTFGDKPIRDAALWGLGGAAGGALAWDAYQANACKERQRKLDGISLKLGGYVSVLSTPALEALIRSNAGSVISEADADTLITEANKLSLHTGQVFDALR